MTPFNLSIIQIIVLGLLAVFAIIILFGSPFTTPENRVRVVTRFGKFLRFSSAGLEFKIPLIDSVGSGWSLAVQERRVVVETKTADNVFVSVEVRVQYELIRAKLWEAVYKLKTWEQFDAYIENTVLAQIPAMTLDEVFSKKDEVANAVLLNLKAVMESFGINLITTLVTEIEPDEKVQASMNEINAAQRMQVAAAHKGEAERILSVKRSEAEAQGKALQGKGIADQRRAIVDGLRDSVAAFQGSVPGSSAQDVMNLVLMTQYFDTLKEMAENSNQNTVMLPHSPGGLADLQNQIRAALISADSLRQSAIGNPQSEIAPGKELS